MKIHFIGIGGVAMAGIANIYKQKGHRVMGSDAESSEITADLQKQGIGIFIGQKAKNITKDIDLVIYSEAVPKNNPELKKARQLKIKCLSGAEALAELAKDYFLIAVSGMHGKTTTASMLAFVLETAGLDPTYIIGAKNGYKLGKSKYLIIEADDYQAKFLHYRPDVLLLTNIDREHLDCLKNLANIMKIFKQYVSQVKQKIIANKDNANVAKLLKNNKKTIFYSLKDKKDVEKLKIILQVPGEHNVSNALAVLKASRLLGIKDSIILEALAQFKGVWRRLEETSLKIKNQKSKIISDYAHHPTEIKASLQALREKYPKNNIWLIFQPHQYQRTFYLFKDFVSIFRKAISELGIDKIILTDIYSVKGRESRTIKKKVDSRKLVKAIGKEQVAYIAQNKLAELIKANNGQFDILVIMGAGDIYKLPSNL